MGERQHEAANRQRIGRERCGDVAERLGVVLITAREPVLAR